MKSVYFSFLCVFICCLLGSLFALGLVVLCFFGVFSLGFYYRCCQLAGKTRLLNERLRVECDAKLLTRGQLHQPYLSLRALSVFKAGTPHDALAPYPRSRSVRWCLAETEIIAIL